MALVAQNRAALTFTVRDRSGSLGKTTIPVTPSITTEQIEALYAAFNAIHDGGSISVSFTTSWLEGTVVTAVNSAVERKGVLIFGNTQRQRIKLEIPSISAAVVKPNDAINEDNAVMATFLGLLLPQLRASGGTSIAVLEQAYRDYRTTGKTQKAGTRIPDEDTDPDN